MHLTPWNHERSDRSARSKPRRRLRLEPLEDRAVPTAYVFVDFGDNFPLNGTNRTLTTNVGAVRDVATAQLDGDGDPIANTVIQGPQLTNANNATPNPPGNRYPDGTAVNFTRFNYTATERASMMAIVRRAFASVDVTVVELTATAQTLADGRSVAGAANMADVAATLRGNNTTSEDAYIISATPAIGASNDNPNNFTTNGYGGIAAGGTVLGELSDLQAGANNHDDLALSFTTANTTFVANTIAHEAGHILGLRHAVTTAAPPGSAINNLIHGSEVMSYLSNDTSFFFSRFPMVRGDSNTDPTPPPPPPAPAPPAPPLNNNDLEARQGQQTPFDQLRVDGNVGENPGLRYISGTGANDIITVTRSGNSANVSVQAFGDAAFTTAIIVPGTAVTTYSYTVALDRALLIQGGGGGDRIVLDGDLGVTVVVDGMLGTDALVIMGKNAAGATYTPGTNDENGTDNVIDRRGTVAIGTTAVSFRGFEETGSVTVRDVGTLTLRTPLSRDFLTVDSPAAGQNQVTGSSDFVPIVPLTFFNVTACTLDTAANDGGSPNDRVTLTPAGLVAAGLQNVTVDTGNGDDTLILPLTNYALPVAGGTFTFQGGDGSDEVQATADVSFTLTDTSLGIVGDGAVGLSSVERASLTGGGSANGFTVSDWTGAAVLRGGGGGDSYAVNFKGTGNGSVLVIDTGAGGTDTGTANGTAAGDTLEVTDLRVSLGGERFTYGSVEDLTVNGQGGSDLVNVRSTPSATPVTVNGGAADDTVGIGNLLNSLDEIRSLVTVRGDGHGAGDVLRVNDQGDADPNTYAVTATAVERAGTPAITYATVEQVVLNGGGGGNVIVVGSTAAGTEVVINAGAGGDHVRVDSNGLLAGGTVDLVVSRVTVNGQGGLNTLWLEDSSDTTGDVLHVGPKAPPAQIGADPADTFFGAGGSLTYTGLDHVTLNLSNGYLGDTVYLVPSETTSYQVHGNDPDCPMNPDQLPGDQLLLDFTGVVSPRLTASGEGPGQWSFANREPVAYTGIEKMNHVQIIVVAPDAGSPPLVRVFGAETREEYFSFLAFDEGFNGGVRVAVGDVNCDAIPDIIVAAGPSGAPEVRVFNGATGAPFDGPLGSFFAYDPGSRNGLFVAAGDVNQDGTADIITGADAGNQPLVRVFDGHTGALLGEFLAYGRNMNGGVRVAVGDLTGDGWPDIVTGPGTGMAPEVRVFDGKLPGYPLATSFLAFANNFRGGIHVAVGDVTGDGIADLVVGNGGGNASLVRVFDGSNLAGGPVAEFTAYDAQFAGGVRVAAVDVDGDGTAEIVTAPGLGSKARAKVFHFDPLQEIADFFADDLHGAFVGAGG